MLTISVVIPTYNCHQYIATAIKSALHSSVVEIIVVDDGSTDETTDVVEDVKQELTADGIDSHLLRYIFQTNRGVSAARNRGIDEARGDLIAFLDADDFFFEQKLSRQIDVFESDETVDIVQCGWKRVNESGGLLETVRPWTEAPKLTIGDFLKFKPILPSALLVRRACLVETKFDTELEAAEDVDLMSRLLLKGYRAEWVKESLVGYRQHGSNAMGNSLKQARDLNKFLDSFFGKPDLPEHVQMLEQAVRYYTLVWVACCLQSTGHYVEMSQQLRKAWQYSPHLPIEALVCWIDSFEKFGLNSPERLDELFNTQEWQDTVGWLLTQGA